MARYIVATAAIPALYGAYKSYYWGCPPDIKIIRNVDEAVEFLNSNKYVSDALKFVNNVEKNNNNEHNNNNNEEEIIRNLKPQAIGFLARSGSELCQKIPVQKCRNDEMDVSEALKKFNLGDKWNSSLEWINRVACPEEDLSCSEEWLVRLPSQVERLRRMLQLLFLTTENEFDIDSIDVDVIPFLFNIYKEFDETQNDISNLTLKILANVVGSNEKYSKKMLNSEWLPLISNMVLNGRNLMERLLAHKICQNALSSLNSIDYRLRSDIYEVHIPEAEPELDIVLIHGLRGSVAYTWRQKDSDENILTTCWPKDWLPYDIKRPFRIFGLDYPSYIIQFTGAQPSLQSRANRFQSQLTDAGIGKRPVLFICHSMGGLLAKQLLLDSPELAKNTIGVLFIATPHKGSPVASWGYSIFNPTNDVIFLNENNLMNKKLNDDFTAISRQIPIIVSMVETVESNLIGTAKGIVVPNKSAVFEQGAVYHIEDMHLNICKPARESASYGVIINFLLDCFREIGRR
ncbi:unnamed protein product [Caenorhabditis angaria]|uniref:GPI inositol-deacylase n=1 Tax=Caenorhabditis angaria TaxID=860376 RepID=A0A9P1J4Q3_9PELO|nr:unnamed protein product [Caenorhabditis angaria]